MTFVVHGLDELAAGLGAQFRQLQGPEIKRAARAGLRAGAALVRDEARRLAPVRAEAKHGHPKGLLRKAITSASANGQGNVLAVAGVYVKGYAYYWRFLEYGTVKMIAHPFLAPAFDNNVDKIGGVVADKLSSAIDAQLAKRQ